MTPTVSLPHVSHTHTEDHVTTEENKPSEQLPKSNGTVKNHISRLVSLLPVGILISV